MQDPRFNHMHRGHRKQLGCARWMESAWRCSFSWTPSPREQIPLKLSSRVKECSPIREMTVFSRCYSLTNVLPMFTIGPCRLFSMHKRPRNWPTKTWDRLQLLLSEGNWPTNQSLCRIIQGQSRRSLFSLSKEDGCPAVIHTMQLRVSCAALSR
jgi:hypothetical protein